MWTVRVVKCDWIALVDWETHQWFPMSGLFLAERQHFLFFFFIFVLFTFTSTSCESDVPTHHTRTCSHMDVFAKTRLDSTEKFKPTCFYVHWRYGKWGTKWINSFVHNVCKPISIYFIVADDCAWLPYICAFRCPCNNHPYEICILFLHYMKSEGYC